MTTSPVPLALSWNPFGDSGATPKHAEGDLLTLGGIAASQLKTPPARASTSLSTDGQISSNPVVSEVTTVSISSNTAYAVNTETPGEAAASSAAGNVISSAPGADGNTNVVTADGSQSTNNAGSVSVSTTVTYADGTTVTSNASLDSDFKTSGNGLARQRLDAFLDGALSVSAILKRLGITQPGDTGTDASTAPTGVAVAATVSSNINVTLTYTAQGDHRSVSGVESGNAAAVITLLDPKQATYTAGGVLSTTRESMNFSGTITGGSLFNTTSAAWLTGSIGESTNAVTRIPGAAAITIDQQSTQTAQFATAGGYSALTSQTQHAAQISFAQEFDDGLAGAQEETITSSLSDASTQSQISNADGTTSKSTSTIGDPSVSITFTPLSTQPLVLSQATLAPKG